MTVDGRSARELLVAPHPLAGRPTRTAWLGLRCRGRLCPVSEEPDSASTPFGEDFDEEEWFQALPEVPHDVVLLPEALRGEGGVYRDEHIAFAKELRSAEVDAGFCHDADRRTYSGRKGGPLLVPLVIGIAANVSTGTAAFAVKRYLDGGLKTESVRLKVIRRRRKGLASEKEVFKATGTGEEVARLYEAFEMGE